MATLLVQKRGRVLASLTKAVTFIENIDENTEVEEIDSRLQKLESWWEEFYNIEDELLLIQNQVTKADEFESKFFSTQAALKRELKKRKPVEPSNNIDLNATLTNMCSQQKAYFESFHNKTINQSNEVKLPKINVPAFNGEYTQWSSFKDMFEVSVHKNDSISRVHKFQLLKGLLQGSADRLINHLLITDASYLEAWDKLKQRYDKKRTIISTIIKTFLDQPAIHYASPKSLRNLTETSDELLRGLKALGPECQSRDPWVLYLVLSKMDEETKQQWSLHSVKTDVPGVNEFLLFLHQRCDALESCNITTKTSKSSSKTLHMATTKAQCTYCNKPHPIHKCYKFQRCEIEWRKGFIRRHDLCPNCLKKGHMVTDCPSTNTCFKCKAKHHTILHDVNNGSSQSKMSANIAIKETNSDSTSLNHSLIYTTTKATVGKKGQPILPTVIMNTLDAEGKIQTIRALLDSGSESTFITESITKKLGLRRQHANIIVNGLASVPSARTRGQVKIKLISRYDAEHFVIANALILGKLTNFLPSQATTIEEYNKVKLDGICLADHTFHKPNPIDIIIGIDIFYDIMQENQILLSPNLHLIETLFGWVVAGYTDHKSNSTTECLTIQINNEDVSQVLQRFWEVKEVSTKFETSEDPCENHFSSTHKFINGRYIVELPLTEKIDQLGNRLNSATTRMLAMERKFRKDVQLRDEYTKFMQEYEKLGHMVRIPDHEVFTESCKMYYLPHHAVFKINNTGKKLRVVFDGSCKSSSGLSLNDVLMTGPTIQDDLFSILTRFRKNNIVFVADVEKMYRQVAVHPKHQNYQRIVWRENSSKTMKHYKLTTVTYGLTCSAYLAIRSLHQVANDAKQLPYKLVSTIKSDFDVDDLLSGCDNVSEAVSMFRELSSTLSHVGFSLRKWSSNSPELLNIIPIEFQGKECFSFEDPEGCIKTLGVCWLTNEDAFTFKVTQLQNEPSTKRQLLSECSKIFDPLGWLAPAIITFKILLQSLWLTKIEWDEILPDSINQLWCAARNDLIHLSGIRIPRYIQKQADCSIQLHGCCDSSEKAYAAVVYARSTNSNGESSVHLIAAKTKVAPLKKPSVPRLELCGAVLLTKLLYKVAVILEVPVNSLYAWTDSTIVLAWLSDVPRRWTCFIANRTSYILEKIPTCH